jgi:hypothetical protein
MAAAHVSLRAGEYRDVVSRAAEAFLELLRRKPELLEGMIGRVRVMFFPRLGVRMEYKGEQELPQVEWDREQFGFAEAVTYFEFAVDQLVREGL